MKNLSLIWAVVIALTLSACKAEVPSANTPHTTSSSSDAISNIEQFYEQIFGLGAKLSYETSEQEKILDAFSKASLNENIRHNSMAVLATERRGDLFYSVVPVLKEGGGLYLVLHTNPSHDIVEIVDIYHGEFPMSSGLYPNIIQTPEGDVFWGICNYDCLGIDPDTGGFDILIENDFSTIEFTMESGNVVTADIVSPSAVLVFLDAEDHVVSCKMLSLSGETGIHYNF